MNAQTAIGPALAFWLAFAPSVGAQDAMQGTTMPAATPAAQPHHPPAHTAPAEPAPASSATPAMPAMEIRAMHGSAASSATRSGDHSDGYTHGAMPGMDMRDAAPHGMLLLDQLEYARWDAGHAFVIDGQAWYGGDFDKLWLKFEGDHSEGRLQDLRTEALWSHAVTAFWDTQLGVRRDSGVGPGRTWAAFGVQGLAPYWFETEATLYVGQAGRTAARIEAEYELRLTQRLILQPRLEANVYGKDDRARGTGPGLSEIDAGLRLRYEIRREFAPYVGIVRVQRFGRSADYARAAGGAAGETQVVAGVRIWY